MSPDKGCHRAIAVAMETGLPLKIAGKNREPREREYFREFVQPHLRGNIVHDLHTAALMREHGIRDIYTRDSDFSRFPFVKVIDPLS